MLRRHLDEFIGVQPRAWKIFAMWIAEHVSWTWGQIRLRRTNEVYGFFHSDRGDD